MIAPLLELATPSIVKRIKRRDLWQHIEGRCSKGWKSIWISNMNQEDKSCRLERLGRYLSVTVALNLVDNVLLLK